MKGQAILDISERPVPVRSPFFLSPSLAFFHAPPNADLDLYTYNEVGRAHVHHL
jgi:hypothetical protein